MIGTKKLLAFLGGVAMLSSGYAAGVAAAPPELRPMTTAELAGASTRAVFAKVISVESKAVAKYGGTLFTFTTFQVIQPIVGSVANPFVVRLIGGQLGDVTVGHEILPTFTPGEEVVLMLGRDNQDGFPTIMIGDGIFRVTALSNGAKVTTTPVTGLPLYRASDGTAYASMPNQVLVVDLIYTLRGASFAPAR